MCTYVCLHMCILTCCLTPLLAPALQLVHPFYPSLPPVCLGMPLRHPYIQTYVQAYVQTYVQAYVRTYRHMYVEQATAHTLTTYNSHNSVRSTSKLSNPYQSFCPPSCCPIQPSCQQWDNQDPRVEGIGYIQAITVILICTYSYAFCMISSTIYIHFALGTFLNRWQYCDIWQSQTKVFFEPPIKLQHHSVVGILSISKVAVVNKAKNNHTYRHVFTADSFPSKAFSYSKTVFLALHTWAIS